MAIREIITIPDPLLRRESTPFERVDDEVRRLADDMLETMYAAPGIGLAGVQIAVPRRILVIDIAERAARDEDGTDGTGKGEADKGEKSPERAVQPAPLVMINPEILTLDDEMRAHEEGCLSIPEVYAEIERPASCRVRFVDREGRQQEMVCEGLLATVVQHEVDHLDGVLFIDYLSRLKRDRIVKRFVKARRMAASETGQGTPAL